MGNVLPVYLRGKFWSKSLRPLTATSLCKIAHSKQDGNGARPFVSEGAGWRRMERADAPGGGLDRRLCLERQDLPEPHEGRVCDHRHPLEWTQILWVARQTVEGICIMNARATKVVRCAIYTRVSTDQGLEQDFNSLDAQYDASQAYIRSQAHAGWSLLP